MRKRTESRPNTRLGNMCHILGIPCKCKFDTDEHFPFISFRLACKGSELVGICLFVSFFSLLFRKCEIEPQHEISAKHHILTAKHITALHRNIIHRALKAHVFLRFGEQGEREERRGGRLKKLTNSMEHTNIPAKNPFSVVWTMFIVQWLKIHFFLYSHEKHTWNLVLRKAGWLVGRSVGRSIACLLAWLLIQCQCWPFPNWFTAHRTFISIYI